MRTKSPLVHPPQRKTLIETQVKLELTEDALVLYFPGVQPVRAALTDDDLQAVRSYIESPKAKGRPKEISDEVMFKFAVLEENELFGGTWVQILDLVFGEGKKPTPRARQKRLREFHRLHKSYKFLRQKMERGESLTPQEESDLFSWWDARSWLNSIEWYNINPLRKGSYTPSRYEAIE